MRLPPGRLARWNRGAASGRRERRWLRGYLILFALAVILAGLLILAGSTG